MTFFSNGLVILLTTLLVSSLSVAQNPLSEAETQAPNLHQELSPLEQLDLVAEKAGSIEGLLSDPNLLDEYKEKLDFYYGQELPRQSFDKIIEQLKVLLKFLPDLERRLWTQGDQNKDWEDFTIQTDLKSSGRRVNRGPWRNYLKNLKQRLKSGAQEILELENPRKERQRVEWILKQVAISHVQMESEVKILRRQGRGKKAQKQRKREWFKALNQDPELNQARSYILLKILQSEETQDVLKSNDPDRIFDYMEIFENLGQKDHSFFEDIAKVPPPLTSFIMAPFPKVSELKRLRGNDPWEKEFIPLFPQKMIPSPVRRTLIPAPSTSKSTVTLRSSPRRLHFIWEGIKFGECVGGRVGNLNALSPERWALSALESVESYTLEENGFHRGSLKLISGEIRSSRLNRETPLWRQKVKVRGIEFNGNLFNKEIRQRDPEDSKEKKIITSFYSELVVRELGRRDPEEKRGALIINRETNEPANTGAIDQFKKFVPYVFAKKEMKGFFHHGDSFAGRLIKTSRRKLNVKDSHQYLGNMVGHISLRKKFYRPSSYRFIDSQVNFKKNIHKLLEFLESKDSRLQSAAIELSFQENVYTEIAWKKIPKLLKVIDPDVRANIIGVLRSQKKWPSEFWDQVALLIGNHQFITRNHFLEALQRQKDWDTGPWRRLTSLLSLKRYVHLSIIRSIENEERELDQETWEYVVSFLRHRDLSIREATIVVLRNQKTWPPEVLEQVYFLLKSKKSSTREATVMALRGHKKWSQKIWDQMYSLLNDRSAKVRIAAAHTFFQKKRLSPEVWSREDWDYAVSFLKDRNLFIRKDATAALGQQKIWPPEVLEQVYFLLKDKKPSTRKAAVKAIKEYEQWSQKVWDQMYSLLNDRSTKVRIAAVRALFRKKRLNPEVWKKILPVFKDKRTSVRVNAIKQLRFLEKWSAEVWERVPNMLKNRNEKIRNFMLYALNLQKDWSEETWNQMIALLQSQKTSIREDVLDAIENQKEWPEKMWEQVVSLLKDKKVSIQTNMVLALEKQQEWVEYTNSLEDFSTIPREDLVNLFLEKKRREKSCLSAVKPFAK